MKAAKVKPGMRNIDLELKVLEKEETYQFENEQGEGEVATAICEDNSGKIKVSLWNEDIERVEAGDKIRIESGYSRLFKDEVHVSSGRYGELKVLDDSEI